MKKVEKTGFLKQAPNLFASFSITRKVYSRLLFVPISQCFYYHTGVTVKLFILHYLGRFGQYSKFRLKCQTP